MHGRAATAVLLLALAAPAFQPKPTGPQLIREGKLDAALDVFRAEAAVSPKSVDANNGAGVVLDLLGRYPEVREYFALAIKAARTDEAKAVAQRAMAISYAFAGDCKGAEKFETRAFEFYRKGAAASLESAEVSRTSITQVKSRPS